MEFDLLLDIVRSTREEAGLSQREVARRLGFHPTIYGKIERGERVLDVVEFVHLGNAIGRSPLEILGLYLVAIEQQKLGSSTKQNADD